MPCGDYSQNDTILEQSKQIKALTRIACDLAQHAVLTACRKETRDWAGAHNREDAERRHREHLEHLEHLKRAKALRKLSPEERKLLGRLRRRAMILKVNGQVWHLHFHTNDTDELDELRAKDNLPPLLWYVVTTCQVHTGPCITRQDGPHSYCITGHVGTAKCSKKDQFVKRVGAKLALADAMELFPQELRKQIWQAYWLRVRRPKEKSDKFRRRIAAAQPQPSVAA